MKTQKGALKKECKRRGLAQHGCDDLMRFRLSQPPNLALTKNIFVAPKEPPPQLVLSHRADYHRMQGVLRLPVDVLAMIVAYCDLRVTREVCHQFFEATRRAWNAMGVRLFGPSGWTWKTHVAYMRNMSNTTKAKAAALYGVKTPTIAALIARYNYVDYAEHWRQFKRRRLDALAREKAFLQERIATWRNEVMQRVCQRDIHFLQCDDAGFVNDKWSLGIVRLYVRLELRLGSTLGNEALGDPIDAANLIVEAVNTRAFGAYTVPVLNNLALNGCNFESHDLHIKFILVIACSEFHWLHARILQRDITMEDRIRCARSIPAVERGWCNAILWDREMRVVSVLYDYEVDHMTCDFIITLETARLGSYSNYLLKNE